MSNIQTTNEPAGITNAAIPSVMQSYGADDPSVFHTYFNDFDVFTAGDWTGTATGSVTNAVIAGDGGILSMINSASGSDQDSLQLKVATFAFVAGSKAWFKAKFSLSNATNANLILGLIQTTTTPLTVVNGVYFSKLAASTTLTCKTTKASTSSSVNVGTLADATMVNVGFHYDGESTITVYLNNVKVGSLPITNLPTVNLNLTMCITNGTGAAITLNVDYLLASIERPSTNL